MMPLPVAAYIWLHHTTLSGNPTSPVIRPTAFRVPLFTQGARARTRQKLGCPRTLALSQTAPVSFAFHTL